MQVKGLSYTGNGTDNRAISGAGFQPDVVIVKRQQFLDSGNGRIALSVMTAGEAKALTLASAPATGFIRSIDADGFTVSTDANVNANGEAYHALCLKAHASDLKVGSYTGNGVDNRSITGVGFQPDLVWVFSNGANLAVWRSSDISGDSTAYWGGTAPAGNRIQALEADGFQVGTDAVVNADTVTYFYVAFKYVAGFAAGIAYTGDASDDRNITGLGLDPDHALVNRHPHFGGEVFNWHPHTIGKTTDLSLTFGASGAGANHIQQLISDGVQVGTAKNGNSLTYAGYALLDGDSQGGGEPPATRRLFVVG